MILKNIISHMMKYLHMVLTNIVTNMLQHLKDTLNLFIKKKREFTIESNTAYF